MKNIDNIKAFCQQIIRYVGNGYKYIQISNIPQNKIHKISKIEEKITKKYNTNLTTWQRQYKRRKGIANFVALRYKTTIIILKTEGNTNIQDKFEDVFNKKNVISFNYLKIRLIKDERNKLTYVLERNLLKDIKAKIKLAIKNKRGNDFHKELNKLYNLHKTLNYRGINKQISDILKMIKTEQKIHGTNFNLPKFF